MKKVLIPLSFAITLALLWMPYETIASERGKYDVVIVGAGISGLSAAWELAHRGIDVAVIEMSHHYGGVAAISEGRISIIGTPEQKRAGIRDTPQAAYKDFMEYGHDDKGPGPDPWWVRYYTEKSRQEIYDWLTNLGVEFNKNVLPMPGNSYPRWHKVTGGGLGLVEPIYEDCLKTKEVTFYWNTKGISLLRNENKIIGIKVKDMTDGKESNFFAKAVILATGGFQNNMEMVKEYWPKDIPAPSHILLGGGYNATGSGHVMAEEVGANLANMNYQWNYSTGLQDPNDNEGKRGINAFSQQSIWVNKEGKRFIRESQDTKETFPAVLKQQGSTYWAIFDNKARETFFVSGWDRPKIEKKIFDNPAMSRWVKSDFTISGLAQKVGLPETLVETISRWNKMVEDGQDSDFGRIGYSRSPWAYPQKIEKPPFYAVQFSPLSRKNMGGVSVDRSCRVVDMLDRPIKGLYAVGELTGLARVNGKFSTEGTFLGAAIITGRVAGRSVADEVRSKKKLDLTR